MASACSSRRLSDPATSTRGSIDHAGRLGLTKPAGTLGIGPAPLASEFLPADHAEARQELDAVASGELRVGEAGEAIVRVEDQGRSGRPRPPPAVSHELDRAAQCLLEAIRQEGLALLGLFGPGRPGNRRARPGRPDIAVEAEAGLRDMRVQVEAQEVRLLLAQHLLQRLDRRWWPMHPGPNCCVCRGWSGRTRMSARCKRRRRACRLRNRNRSADTQSSSRNGRMGHPVAADVAELDLAQGDLGVRAPEQFELRRA